jgi:hypothetical protein
MLCNASRQNKMVILWSSPWTWVWSHQNGWSQLSHLWLWPGLDRQSVKVVDQYKMGRKWVITWFTINEHRFNVDAVRHSSESTRRGSLRCSAESIKCERRFIPPDSSAGKANVVFTSVTGLKLYGDRGYEMAHGLV